jgi:hypothetical protein
MKLKKKLKRGQKIAIKRIRTKFDIKKILHPTRHVNWEKKGGERKKKKRRQSYTKLSSLPHAAS